jgi:hypothetical protein
MKHTKSTLLKGLTLQRKLTGEVFTITGKEGSFFLLNGGADKGGRDVMGSELCYYTRVKVCDCQPVVNTTTPLEHTFVLADLFTFEAHSTTPDYLLETEAGLESLMCPTCQGEKCLETQNNGWTSALFADPKRAYVHRALRTSYKPCGQCSGVGEITSPLDEKYESYEKCLLSETPLQLAA